MTLHTRIPLSVVLSAVGPLHADYNIEGIEFGPAAIIDRSTYTDPTLPSVGVHFLVMNGTLVIDGQTFVDSVRPGRPLRAQSR